MLQDVYLECHNNAIARSDQHRDRLYRRSNCPFVSIVPGQLKSYGNGFQIVTWNRWGKPFFMHIRIPIMVLGCEMPIREVDR